MMLFNVVVLINVCMIFFEQEEETDVTADDAVSARMLAAVTMTSHLAKDHNESYDHAMLRGWYAIEVCMFSGNVIANMIFVLTRSCSRIRILGTRTTAVVTTNTDMIEEQ